MNTLSKNITLAIAALGMTASAVPAMATDFGHVRTGVSAAPKEDSWNRHRRDDRRYRQAYYGGESVNRNTRVWRGNDGRTYCRKKDGTTGLIIGGAAGALLGREVDSSGDRALGTILGAAAGALIGKELDDGMKCR
ncbi:glycine zipper 2TM domain-containing protein [Altererythrobacter sp. Root672]|uniref:glycine zipper 2TM domain-containing protein n=1 Tax=Altererythrobacter sp. Root672 TaxID=1736584 RepID=UPI0006FBA87A|nr:glycine zipper 2TM domain-containing protein [Altererythrobacter sp. Root672]KRA84557.1 hypothetical protein ASD76_01940 [Altererythrobacter sp. Root672]